MEIGQLTSFLAPLLAPLIAGTQDAAAAAIKDVGKAAWDHAQKLWQHLGDRIFEREAAKEAAEDVAKAPDDTKARAALEWQVDKLLKSDPQLLAAVSKLWDEGQASIGSEISYVMAIGEGSVAAKSISNSTIYAGTGGGSRPRPEDDRDPKAG